VLFGDKYRDWHNIQTLKSYFNKIIDPKVNPFRELSKEQLDSLNFTYILHNYLSHYSEYSKQKLFLIYKEYHSYKKFIEPGSFLIKQNGKHFESLLHNFILISVTIRKKIGV